jgi:hypothetical protein
LIRKRRKSFEITDNMQVLLHFWQCCKVFIVYRFKKDVKSFKKLPNSRMKNRKKPKMQEYLLKHITLLNSPWENSVWRQRESVQWKNKKKEYQAFMLSCNLARRGYTLYSVSGKTQKEGSGSLCRCLRWREREGRKGPNKTTAKGTLGVWASFFIFPLYGLFILFWIPRLLLRRWMPMVWSYIYIISGPVFFRIFFQSWYSWVFSDGPWT